MARIMMCGWETGDLQELPGVLIGSAARQQIIAGRTGSNALALDISTTAAGLQSSRKFFGIPGEPDEIYMRIAIKISNFTSGPHDILTFYDTAGTSQIIIRRASGVGTLNAFRGATDLGACGTLSTSVWQVWQIYLKVRDSGGRLRILVDGLVVLDFTGDTRNSTVEDKIGSFHLGTFNSGLDSVIGQQVQFDDLAVNDISGSVNNSWIGSGGIVSLTPNGDTADKNFGRSAGSDNFALVDEIPSDNDTTYVEDGIVAERDLYDFTNQTGKSVSAVQLIIDAKSVSGSAGKLTPNLKSGATLNSGATVYPGSGAYQQILGAIHNVDPNTGQPWTLAALNALQAGMTVA